MQSQYKSLDQREQLAFQRDGNTDGYFLNQSTTHTKLEYKPWWQVDLGSQKKINKIIIYNRTDCCVNRLSAYRVSISNEADFSTHTYQQDFHVAWHVFQGLD
jgi:hypothetical protein